MRIGENARIFFSEREKSVPAMRVTTLVNKLIGLQGLWVRGFHFQADKARVVVDVVPRRRKPLCGICALCANIAETLRPSTLISRGEVSQRCWHRGGPQRAAELEAVSMDMWEPYITVVGKKAPQARVIFDRFHIVKHLNEAVDKTRRELVRELKGTARRNLKNTKFPLLKAKHNRSAKDKRVLREQVRANLKFLGRMNPLTV